jgi:Family of unknown function (DUF5771)
MHYITRKSYHATRKGTRYTVKASRVHDMGAKGKWASIHGPGIGSLKKGELMGYSPTMKAPARRKTLRKVVAKVGPLSTFRKLNAVAVYTKRTAPKTSRTYKADRKWVKKNFM